MFVQIDSKTLDDEVDDEVDDTFIPVNNILEQKEEITVAPSVQEQKSVTPSTNEVTQEEGVTIENDI